MTMARALLLGVLLLLLTGSVITPAAWAGQVDWQEVPAGAAGRQWWDRGSLHRSRGGNLSVLSRFQPAVSPESASSRPPASNLYVMEIDCAQALFRDVSVNGLPQLRAEWQPSGADPLIDAVIEEACAAGQDRLS
jgi:hypothetical protein